jgi:hypothetical protein
MARRVVTGEKGGRSVFLSDGPAANTRNYVEVPGFQTTLAWTNMLGVAPLPDGGKDPVVSIPVGGTRSARYPRDGGAVPTG